MPDLPITDEAMEAAAKTLMSHARPTGMDYWAEGQRGQYWQDLASAAIQAFLIAEGFEVERKDYPEVWEMSSDEIARAIKGHPVGLYHRLVNPWRPDALATITRERDEAKQSADWMRKVADDNYERAERAETDLKEALDAVEGLYRRAANSTFDAARKLLRCHGRL